MKLLLHARMQCEGGKGITRSVGRWRSTLRYHFPVGSLHPLVAKLANKFHLIPRDVYLLAFASFLSHSMCGKFIFLFHLLTGCTLNPIFLTLSRNPFFHQKRISLRTHVPTLKFIKYLMPSSPLNVEVQFNFVAVVGGENGSQQQHRNERTESSSIPVCSNDSISYFTSYFHVVSPPCS